ADSPVKGELQGLAGRDLSLLRIRWRRWRDGCLLSSCPGTEQQQAKQSPIKNDWSLFVGSAFVARPVFLLADDFFHNGLVQTAFGYQLAPFVVHRLQQHLARSVNEAHPAEVHVELFLW